MLDQEKALLILLHGLFRARKTQVVHPNFQRKRVRVKGWWHRDAQIIEGQHEESRKS